MSKKLILPITLTILIIAVIFTTIVLALSITLNEPQSSSIIGNNTIKFTYTLDEVADNCTIYHNISSWTPISTNTNPVAGENNFTLTINNEGTYKWNILCLNENTSFWATNNSTFTLDLKAPQINLINPENNYETTTNDVTFEYFVLDKGKINNCKLLINGLENQTNNNPTNNANNYFYLTIPLGAYTWAISCTDSVNRTNTTNTRNLSIISGLEWNTSTLNLGQTPSTNDAITKTVTLNAINLNENISISCNGDCDKITHNFFMQSANDEPLNIDFSCSSNEPNNYTATFNATSKQYIKGATINVECKVFEAKPDLSINDSTIYFEGELIEGEEIYLKANVTNIGDIQAFNVNTSFYLNDELIGYELKDIQTLTTITFTSACKLSMGNNKINIRVNEENSIQEYSQNNNDATMNLTVSSWQLITGNITGNFVLQDSNNNTVFSWKKELLDGSNLFVVDADSSINWHELIALTRDANGNFRANDFQTLDSILKTTTNSDSINNTFNANFETSSFNVFGKEINNVPIIHTTPEKFQTGILWDPTKDTNGFYDSTNREDIVFITNIISETQTNLGTFDYEIKFAAALREYAQPNESNNVAIYVELK